MEHLRRHLCELGAHLRDTLMAARRDRTDDLTAVSHRTAADTIYVVDAISETAVIAWFEQNWPREEPVELVMEGLEHELCFPAGTEIAATKWKCLLDPIDGTRGFMYDKRSAWVLAALAPQQGAGTLLSQIAVACMTELPTSKQWRADQLSAVRGGGVQADSLNILNRTRAPLAVKPSAATDFHHGFAWLAKFFPAGRTLTAQIEERLWDELLPGETDGIFDDQYLSTGGAFYELLMGHDRLVGDIRPLVHARLQIDTHLVCHPYDACAALLLEEAGVIYEHPLGGFPDAPMDTTSGIAWVAYANPALAAQARPVLRKLLDQFLA